MQNFIQQLSKIFGTSPETTWLLVGVFAGLVVAKLFRSGNVSAGMSVGNLPSGPSSSLFQSQASPLFDCAVGECFQSGALQLNLHGKKVSVEGAKFEEFRQLLERRRKIEAIKLLRQETGMDLVDAKAICDALGNVSHTSAHS